MSFTVSNQNSGNFITALSGANGIATQTSFSWSDVGSVVVNPTAFLKASSGQVWVGVSGFIYIYANLTFTNLPVFIYTLNAGTDVNVFYESNGFMYVGGQFAGVVGEMNAQFSLMRFAGSSTLTPTYDAMYSSTGQNGFNGPVNAITSDGVNLYVGGLFSSTFTTPMSLENLCIVGNPFAAGGTQTFTNDIQIGVANFTANGEIYAMCYSTGNVYYTGNFTNVASGFQLISYAAFYTPNWTTSSNGTIGLGNFNSPPYSLAMATAPNATKLLFSGGFNFVENSTQIKYGGYIDVNTPFNACLPFAINGLTASSRRNTLNVNGGLNMMIMDDLQVWYGGDINLWEDGGIAFTSGTPSGIVYDSATSHPYVAMPTSTTGFRVGSPLSYLYYSTNSGASWTLPSNSSGSVPDVTFSSISLDLLSGQNGVAAGIDNTLYPAVYYTTNGGSSWSASAGLPLIATSSILVSIFGLYAVVGINTSTTYEVYYSNDGGSSWTIWSFSPSAIVGQVTNVAVGSLSMVVATIEGANTQIYNNTNNPLGSGSWFNGYTVATSVVTITSLSLSGANSVACGQNYGGPSGTNGLIDYSANSCNTWQNPTTYPSWANNITKVVSIDGSVAMIGGISTSNTAFIWYSINGGGLWTNSSFVLANVSSFTGISVSGNNGLASINTNDGFGRLFYSKDQGQSWTAAAGGALSATTINDVSLSGDEGVAGTSAGIYYTSTPLCYEANTLILITENEEEVYKKVSELKVGDLVKTYKQGYKKIKLFRSFKYNPLNKNNDLNLLYKHKENGVIVTGGHSILVDELTEKEKLNNLKHYGFNQTIEDKKLLLACSSDKFEKIDYRNEYYLCHFSLESDDPKEHFGVYMTDGILSESCPEEALLKIMF